MTDNAISQGLWRGRHSVLLSTPDSSRLSASETQL
jgi:hypothetical protein